MMDIYQIIETYRKNCGESKVWESVAFISKAIEECIDEETKRGLKRKIYSLMVAGHYNEDFAKEDVEKMYYKDSSGEYHCAPYFTEGETLEIYEQIRDSISSYNCWDFYVTLNMIVSDNHDLLERWFPDCKMEEMRKRYTELAINWLNDDDCGTEKIWKYLNK